MKVCSTVLITLLACLLALPSDVNGRMLEETGEEEASRVRRQNAPKNRSKPSAGYDLEKTCEYSHKVYGIDKDDCMKPNKTAMYSCFLKVKEDRSNFKSICIYYGPMSQSGPSVSASEPALLVNPTEPASAASSLKEGGGEGGATVPKGDEFFTPDNLPKTCQVCKIFKVDTEACLASDGEARKHCKKMVEEM